jgi:hypothetical protein
MVNANADKIYYNFVVRNEQPGDTIINLEFDENRVQAVVEQPWKYEIAVERLKIPLTSIPIFLWQDGIFSVKMTYGATEITKILQFIPNGGSPYGDAVFSYEEWLTIVNTALDECFNDLKAAEPGMPPSESPFITLDPVSNLCIWNVEQSYNTLGDETKVFMNQDLYFKFYSFQNVATDFGGVTWYELPTKDNFNNSNVINGLQYYSTYQEFPVLPALNDFQSVLFETDMPLNYEYLPAQQNDVRTILTDFLPVDEIQDRQVLQYYPRGPLRYYDLLSKVPLRRLKLNAYWLNRKGQRFPFYLTRQDTFTMKVVFRRKYD